MNVAQYLFDLPARLFGKEQLTSALPTIPRELSEALEKRLGLLFAAETPEANLCLAQSEEVRPDFRTSFHTRELLQALYALQILEANQPLAPGQLHLPFPSDPDLFWKLVEYGGHLISFHTLDYNITEEQRAYFPVKTIYEAESEIKIASVDFHPNLDIPAIGDIWINPSQHFEHIPITVWEYRINEKAPAKEWLLLHKGSPLTPALLLQYQKVLIALSETVRICNAMQRLDIKEDRLSIY